MCSELYLTANFYSYRIMCYNIKIQLIFIYIAPVTIKIVSKALYRIERQNNMYIVI